jgi:hypothetical protein
MALTDGVTITWNCGPKGRAGQGGKASTGGSTARLTSANIVAQDAAMASWASAIAPLSKAVVASTGIEHGVGVSNVVPGTPQNKGEKWVVTMLESAGNKRFFTHTIPSADESGTHVLPNTLNYNPADADWIAYTSAANAFLTTPDGNAMVLNFATLLTRRR